MVFVCLWCRNTYITKETLIYHMNTRCIKKHMNKCNNCNIIDENNTKNTDMLINKIKKLECENNKLKRNMKLSSKTKKQYVNKGTINNIYIIDNIKRHNILKGIKPYKFIDG